MVHHDLSPGCVCYSYDKDQQQEMFGLGYQNVESPISYFSLILFEKYIWKHYKYKVKRVSGKNIINMTFINFVLTT